MDGNLPGCFVCPYSRSKQFARKWDAPITHCTGRKGYGQLFPCQSSPFLGELPPELVEHADAANKKNVVQSEGLKFFEAMKASLGEG